MRTLREVALRGVIWNACDKLFNQLGYLAATLYIAREIGPAAFGLVGMLTIFVLLAESTVSNGFSQALVQRSHRLTEVDKSTIFYVNLVWGITLFVILYASAPLIAEFYKEPILIDLARLLFVIVIISSLTVVTRAQLIILVDFRSQAISGTISTVVSSALGIYLATRGYEHWSFAWLLISKAMVNNICLWLFSRWLPSFDFSMKSFTSLFKFGSNLMMAGIVATFVNNLYIVMIGRYFDTASVGYFTQANNLSGFLSKFISSTLQGVTYPIFSSLQEDRDRLESLYKKAISITMLGSFPALVGFAGVADSFVLVALGEKWLATVPIIQILCFARVITPISSINMNILNAIGRSDLFLKVDLSKLPMTLGALVISVPFGVYAVAWAMLVTSFISFFINAYFPGKFFGFGGIQQLVAAKNYILAGSVMFMIVQFITLSNPWVDLAISICVGAFVYIMILTLLRDQAIRSAFRFVG